MCEAHTSQDPYLYPGTNVLINRFHITDQAALAICEAEFVGLKMRLLSTNPIDGFFDYPHLCAIHKFLFDDLYFWAGQQRTIFIEKAEAILQGRSIKYTPPDQIEDHSKRILHAMRSIDWNQLSETQKAIDLSNFMAALWKTHPFREGNSRAVIAFCCSFAKCQGFPLDLSVIAQSGFLRVALVAASANFLELGCDSQPQYLQKLILKSMRDGRNHCKHSF